MIQVALTTVIGRVAQTGTALDVVDPNDPITILAPLVAVLAAVAVAYMPRSLGRDTRLWRAVRSLTWSTAVLWPRGNPPSVTDGAGEIDRFAFTCIDGDWLGSEAGAGFAPSGITLPDNTVAHYDASKLSLNDGDTVSVWPDEQGDNDLDIQTGSPTYVESGINGNPAIEFNGDGDALEGTGLSVTQPNTTYVVFEY